MSNIAGKCYGMNVITPMPPSCSWLQRLIFMVARARPGTLSGLLGLRLIHFARWVIIKRDQWPAGDRGKPVLAHDYMLFCSNFNGTWDQYIDAFADGIPSGLDLFWYTSMKYPASIPISGFKSYITRNQFHTGYYYNATPGSAQRDIKSALKLYAELKSLAGKYETLGSKPNEFAAEYRKSLARIQNCLGSPGYAPIASLDTANADLNREPFVLAQAKKTKAPPATPLSPPITPPPSTPITPTAPSSTRSFDGGHCFLTALLPIQTCEVVNAAGLRSSHVHMVRDALAILPTAHQSPVTERLTVISPFAECTKTHFARIAVIDDVIFNGRMATDAILDQSDRTIPHPADQLPSPYLMVVIDFDAPKGTEAELRDYLCNVWLTMSNALEPVFEHCFGFKPNMNPNEFAGFIIGCQVETTMPFNDYWPDLPPLPSLSSKTMGVVGAGTFAVAASVLFAALGTLNLPVPVPIASSWAFGGLALTSLFATAAAGYAIVRSLIRKTSSASRVALKGLAAWIVTLAILLTALNLSLAQPIGYSWSVLFEIVGANIVFLVAVIPAAYAVYRLVMARGARPFPKAPNSDLPSILKALYLQRQFIAFAIKMQDQSDAALCTAFAKFLGNTDVNNTNHPTQKPGRIR